MITKSILFAFDRKEYILDERRYQMKAKLAVFFVWVTFEIFLKESIAVALQGTILNECAHLFPR